VLIEVDLPNGSVALRQPGAFDRISVAVAVAVAGEGEGEGSVDELVAVVVRSGLGRVHPDGAHVVVDPAALRRLAGDAVTSSWEAGFEGMCAYAAGKGWVEADGGILAHIEGSDGSGHGLLSARLRWLPCGPRCTGSDPRVPSRYPPTQGGRMAIRDYDRLFIGGDWIAPGGTETIGVISPSTEEVIARVPEGTEADIDKAVAAARTAFDRGPWPRMTPGERGAILAKVAAQIMAEMADLAEIITSEMGSPISFATMGQVLAPSMVFGYYADMASTFAFDEIRTGLLNPSVLVTKEPVGVVGAIAPWNVPLFIAAAKLAPSLLAGCTVVYKPAPETPFDAFRLAEIFTDAGLPKGVLSVIPAGRQVSEHLVTHPGVDKISFTGSGVGGKRIGGLCGERLKRCTLELGGKSAAIILDDADLSTTIPALLPNALMNNGQACVAQTRILAPRASYDEVVDAVVSGVAAMVVGDPMDPATEVGPVVAERQRARIEGYLDSGREEGATVALGGGRPGGFDKGWYVEPTVFSHVDNKMKIAQEEIFGPVLVVIPYDGDEQAVEIANDSSYGLCGSVWTGDNDRGLGIARQVRTGTYMLNATSPIDFATPFGGYKESGVGREFGPEGLESFLEKKSIALPAGYTPGI
jgi:betaine-aldehyde dehydrogenase